MTIDNTQVVNFTGLEEGKMCCTHAHTHQQYTFTPLLRPLLVQCYMLYVLRVGVVFPIVAQQLSRNVQRRNLSPADASWHINKNQ